MQSCRNPVNAMQAAPELNLRRMLEEHNHKRSLEELATKPGLLRLEVRGVQGELVVEVLEAVAEHQGLQELDMAFNYPYSCSLDMVLPKLLVRAVTKLVRLDLSGTALTAAQATALCTAMAQGSKLTCLNMAENDLAEVPAEVLAAAVGTLVEVNLGNTSLNHQQAAAVWAAMARASGVTKVVMSDNNMSQVPVEVLVQVATRVQVLGLSGYGNTRLTGQQVAALFAALSEKNNLIDLDLGFSLAAVPGDVLVKVVTKVAKVQLNKTALVAEQVLQLCEALATQDCLLVDLDLTRNDLYMVEPRLLARAVNRLEVAYLFDTDLNKHQVAAILQLSVCTDHGQSKLKELCLGEEDCEAKGFVDPSLIAAARRQILKMEINDFEYAGSTMEELVNEGYY